MCQYATHVSGDIIQTDVSLDSTNSIKMSLSMLTIHKYDNCFTCYQKRPIKTRGKLFSLCYLDSR